MLSNATRNARNPLGDQGVSSFPGQGLYKARNPC